MSYTFAGINIETEYGIGVEDVRGHLDFPKRKEPTEYSFEDKFGSEAFHTEDDIKWDARDITLFCHMKAATKAEFYDRLSKLKSDLLQEGEQDLVLEHALNTYRVHYRGDQGVFNRITRWNDTKNVGQFRLVFRESVPSHPAIWRGLVGHWSLSESDEEEETASYESDFSAGVDGWTATRGTVAGNIDGIDGEDDNLRFTVNTDNNNHYSRKASVFTVGKRYKVTFSYYIPSGQSNLNMIYMSSGCWSQNQYLTTNDAWAEVSASFSAGQTDFDIYAGSGGNIVFQDAGGDDVFYIRGVTVQEITQADLSNNDNDASMYKFSADPYTTDREGVSNKALTFDGSDDYLDTGGAYQSTFRDSFSISMWVKPDDGQPASEGMFFGVRDSGNECWIMFKLRTDGKLALYYESTGGKWAYTDSVVFSNGGQSWTHLVATANNDTGQLDIFVDGEKQDLDSTQDGDISEINMSELVNTKELFIGGYNNSGAAAALFDGDLHDCKLYNRALTDEEIKVLYHTYNDLMDF